jgi:hypothetical protein
MNRRHPLRTAISASVAIRVLAVGAQGPATALRRIGVLAPSTQAKEAVILKPF